MKATVQPTNKDLFKALSYIGALFAVTVLTFAGADLIDMFMKLIFGL